MSARGSPSELSKLGINLVLIARKPGPLEETAAKARAHGVEVRTLALDLLVPDALDQIKAVTDDVEVGPAHLQRRRQQLRPRVRHR